jgi:hypothetical protein
MNKEPNIYPEDSRPLHFGEGALISGSIGTEIFFAFGERLIDELRMEDWVECTICSWTQNDQWEHPGSMNIAHFKRVDNGKVTSCIAGRSDGTDPNPRLRVRKLS